MKIQLSVIKISNVSENMDLLVVSSIASWSRSDPPGWIITLMCLQDVT